MYLGASAPTSPGMQAGSIVASTAAKYGTSAAITAFAPAAFGSYAGPIGTAVGLIVSFLMSLFGAKMKDPVFGIVAIIPEADNEVVKVGRMLDLLNKRMFDKGYTWGIKDKSKITELGIQVKIFLDQAPQGALSIASGGLPTSHPQVSKIDFGKLLSFTSQISKPFLDSLSLLQEDVKLQILNEPLAYKASTSYYFQIQKGPGKEPGPPGTKGESRWATAGISQRYDAVKISGTQALGTAMERAWKSIPKQINNAFIKYAGVDILTGSVVNQDLAAKALKPQSATASILPQSGIGWVALIGALFLFSK